MMTAVMANGNWDPSLSRLLASLEESRQELPSSEEEFGFLSSLLQSRELHALVQVHNKILDNGRDDNFRPVLSTSMQVALETLDVLLPRISLSNDCKQLFLLLQTPHLQGLLCAHDAVAQKDYFPRLPEIPLEVDEDEETIKIVQLVKSNEPLGATIKTDEETGKIVIARVMHGGAADRSGLIHVGDEVVEVNNINVEGKTPNDVLKILQASEGTITFKLIPAEGKGGIRESKVRVRAHFDYSAYGDPYIPCKEAGLDFVKGDVLHIVSQDDAYWWQARKEGDRDMRAGLIPSRALQERRVMHERAQEDKPTKEEDGVMISCVNTEPRLGLSLDACYPGLPLPPLTVHLPLSPCTLPDEEGIAVSDCQSKNTKTKKIIYDAEEREDFDREEIPTYEEVAKLYPRVGLPRPIVLIGPPGVGRNELKRRLIATDPDKFRTPIPSVHLVMTNVSVALRMVRTPQLKPYIIYIKPPDFEGLKETRNTAFARSTFDENNSRGFTDDEFHDIIHSSKRIEFLYSHLFDETIVNADLSSAFEQLVCAVSRVETEPLWVPASWVQ
ncbi:MAGUK p55 subfamily member 7 [Nilaparvata lugens]|uniref:MAGUK p55 subfamily member 7 n=1 Tax=Nilaparvata lugens TaxID=108931 RepID=UPI00193D2DBC|nr:MAGUK p55 subfamily member 7 [Nilaparvata lugens]